uniref:Fibronectin type-III domain-containing protein n=1 Tax=Cynoglossus semilaevis TaxID=244447 RepID=A0A3P8VL08_CYNSE
MFSLRPCIKTPCSAKSSHPLSTASIFIRQVDVRDVTDTTALVTWFKPVAHVDRVSVSYGPSSDPSDRSVVDLSSTDTQYHLGGLVPGTQYKVSLTGQMGERSSIPVYKSFLTDLDAPRNLQTVDMTDESITLEWRNSQAHVDNYRIKSGPLSGEEHGELLFGPGPKDTTQARITGTVPLGNSTKDHFSILHFSYTILPKWKQPLAKFDHYRLIHVSADGHRTEEDVPGSSDTHTLTGLTPGMMYTISITAERGRKSSIPSTISALTGHQCFFPHLQVFLRCQSRKVEFFHNWKNYTAEFGDMNDEFCLSNLHKITAGDQYELRVDLRDKEETAYAQYDKFSVSEPRIRYKVHVGGYSGTAGKPNSINLLLRAFWYKNCHRVNLMGRYGDNSHSKGVNWFHWKGHEHSIEFEVKLFKGGFHDLVFL